MVRLNLTAVLGSCVCLACASEPTPDQFGVEGTAADGGTGSSGSAVTGGPSDSQTGASVDDTADGGKPDGGEIFDVGNADDGIGPSDGCEKIDFLFVVDNSGSMGAHQSNLINSFGPFIDTIFSTVEAQDYHIMVVDSDADEDLGGCQPCPWDGSYCGDFCDVMPTLHECEGIIGAGEIGPYNNEASNRDCGVPNGVRYLTSDLSEAEIKDKFACMAQVGIYGSGAEKPMTAVAEALTTQAQPGECNDGFLRDDAVLVVTVITDDYPSSNADDASSNGTVDGWYNAIVEAKNGIPEHVVFLGILNLAESTCVQEGSAGSGPVVHPTQKFVDLVDRFGVRGITGDVCSVPDYSGFFAEAVGLIDTTCDEFEPEG